MTLSRHAKVMFASGALAVGALSLWIGPDVNKADRVLSHIFHPEYQQQLGGWQRQRLAIETAWCINTRRLGLNRDCPLELERAYQQAMPGVNVRERLTQAGL